MKRISAALLILLGLANAALAQTVRGPIPNSGVYGAYNTSPPTCVDASGCWLQTDANGQLKVTGSLSSSIAGFTPGLTYASLTASGSSASVALPAGATVAFQNTGTTTVSCTLGVGSATATAGMIQVPPSSTIFLTVGANTFGACIDESGSVSNVVRLAGGAGLGTGFGGGGGSGGGGGAITAASGSYASGALSAGSIAAGAGVDGWDLTQGAIADAAVTAGATGSISAKLRALSRDIGTVATNTGAAIPPQSVAVPIGGIGLCDGANGSTNPCTTAQTVLAASTASAAANKPAVVALHPSSATPATANPYPFGATPYTATATGTTGATTATLAGASSVTTYLCGFSIRSNATAAATGNATVTGVITATLNYNHWTAPVASGIGVTEQIFQPCIPASGTNQSVAVVSPAPGSGGVVSVTAWGYKL